MSGTSMSRATRPGLSGLTNVLMLVIPRLPKTSSRFGEASQPVILILRDVVVCHDRRHGPSPSLPPSLGRYADSPTAPGSAQHHRRRAPRRGLADRRVGVSDVLSGPHDRQCLHCQPSSAKGRPCACQAAWSLVRRLLRLGFELLALAVALGLVPPERDPPSEAERRTRRTGRPAGPPLLGAPRSCVAALAIASRSWARLLDRAE